MTIDITRARAAKGGPARAVRVWRPAASVAPAAALLVAAAFPAGPFAQIVLPFALSFALISPFAFALKPRVIPFILGATAVAILALVVELEASNLAGDAIGPTLVLLLIAPITEELLKLATSAATGGTYRTAAGAGLGFAATENAVYYMAAWNGPTASLAVLVLLRSISDPLIHVDAATLTTSSLRGNTAGLPAGILLHMGWNALSLVAVELPDALGLLVYAMVIAALALLLHLLHREPAARAALADRHSLFPWLGIET